MSLGTILTNKNEVSDERRRRINSRNVRFVAFPATEYDEVFSGYQPG
jgi:hypothetical protein